MLNVGLTGNIAAGKSTVAALFRRRGATIVDADALVHELQAPGTPVFEAIVARFGPEIVGPDGTLDRAALRARVLADPAELAALNAIVHPAVFRRRAELLEEARARGDRVVISDIPLLFEVGDPASFDAVVLVDAPTAARRDRLVRVRGLSEAEADRLIAAQMPAAVKRARADFVIDNDGDLPALERRVAEVWSALLARA